MHFKLFKFFRGISLYSRMLSLRSGSDSIRLEPYPDMLFPVTNASFQNSLNLTDSDEIQISFFDQLLHNLKLNNPLILQPRELSRLLLTGEKMFAKEPSLLRLSRLSNESEKTSATKVDGLEKGTSITLVGDLHGQFYDFLNIFKTGMLIVANDRKLKQIYLLYIILL